MKTLRIFIASSSELSEERDKLETFIHRQNDRLIEQGIRLKPERWENFLDTISISGLQSEYNQRIRECNFVVCLFYTKVGRYTAEEFHIALKEFKETGEPRIWTYFKNAGPASMSEITQDNINTVFAFQKELKDLGHYYTLYDNYDNLINQLREQFDKILPEYYESNNKETSYPESSTDDKKENINIVEDPPLENFNELLTKRLIKAIQPFNKKANEFLVTYPDWETNSDLVPTAQQIIISGYVGVLGIQLRKLISIGKEKSSYRKINLVEERMNRYLENCQLTAKRALQLISYALLSALWDHKLNSNVKLTQSQTTTLIKFFKNTTEENIYGFVDLLRVLIIIFSENKLEHPIPQLNEFQLHLKAESEFISACSNLNSITEVLDTTYTIKDCLEAEKSLVVVLEYLNFLAEYKMISIKDIGYNHQRNDPEGIYLHNYSLIEVGKTTNDQEKVRKETSPVISYAVLLYKKNYRENINMVPFVIDYNALGLSGGSKIGFYSFCNTFDNLALNYSFIDDNQVVSIQKSTNQKPDDKDSQTLNVWLANKENRKDMNFDKVYDLFNQVKKSLAGIEEERLEDIL